MPAALVQSFAKQAGVPVTRAEALWDKAKELVTAGYPDRKEGEPEFYQLVVGILRHMLGIKKKTESSDCSYGREDKCITTHHLCEYFNRTDGTYDFEGCSVYHSNCPSKLSEYRKLIRKKFKKIIESVPLDQLDPDDFNLEVTDGNTHLHVKDQVIDFGELDIHQDPYDLLSEVRSRIIEKFGLRIGLNDESSVSSSQVLNLIMEEKNVGDALDEIRSRTKKDAIILKCTEQQITIEYEGSVEIYEGDCRSMITRIRRSSDNVSLNRFKSSMRFVRKFSVNEYGRSSTSKSSLELLKKHLPAVRRPVIIVKIDESTEITLKDGNTEVVTVKGITPGSNLRSIDMMKEVFDLAGVYYRLEDIITEKIGTYIFTTDAITRLDNDSC